MGGALLLLALGVVSTQFGWQPDGNGGLEYIIQVPPEKIAEQREFEAVIDPRVRGLVTRVIVRIGNDPPPREFGNLAPNTVAASGLPSVTETQVRQADNQDVIRGQNNFALPTGMPSTGGVTSSPVAPRSGLPSTTPFTAGDSATRRPAPSTASQPLQNYRGVGGNPATSSPTGSVGAVASGIPKTGSELPSTSPWTSTSDPQSTLRSGNQFRNPATSTIAGSSNAAGTQTTLPAQYNAALANQPNNTTYPTTSNGAGLKTFGTPSTQTNVNPQTGYNYGALTAGTTNPQLTTGQIPGQQFATTNTAAPGGPLRSGLSSTGQLTNNTAPLTNVPSFQTGLTNQYPGGATTPLLAAGGNTHSNIPLAPPRNNDTMLTESSATAMLLAQQERERTRELQRINDSLEQEKAALLIDNQSLLEADQVNKRRVNEANASLLQVTDNLSQVNESLSLEKERAENMKFFPFFLMVSFVANFYFLFDLLKLKQRYRELVTNVRTSASPSAQAV